MLDFCLNFIVLSLCHSIHGILSTFPSNEYENEDEKYIYLSIDHVLIFLFQLGEISPTILLKCLFSLC
jgi:hypothetical protein